MVDDLLEARLQAVHVPEVGDDRVELFAVFLKDVQLARIAHRQATTPHQTFPMSEADVDQWREQFQVPDADELDGGEIPSPPAGWPGWAEWAVDHWPSRISRPALSNPR
ncbi:hypothetical protein [Streptomyces caelestis]|uniref:hypothetical protein n=1 Tax=Streptomyces caelestis TaxID=36816 RepID=UPI0036F904E2